jgi:hypothetical protein
MAGTFARPRRSPLLHQERGRGCGRAAEVPLDGLAPRRHHVPGRLATGRFWMGSPHRWVFLNLRKSSKEVLVLELQNYRYDVVMVEVDDVARVLEMIRRG